MHAKEQLKQNIPPNNGIDTVFSIADKYEEENDSELDYV
jgi:hypothetical protein